MGTMLAELGSIQIEALQKYLETYRCNFPKTDAPLLVGLNKEANLISLSAEAEGIKLATIIEL